MSDGGALMNLGDVSKPATVLIEKISDAIGGIAKPWQVKRVAKAEAEADLIHAQAKIKISDMEQRALTRMVHEEGKKQENIESITAKAIPQLSNESKPEQIESDWLTYFFDRGRLVSDQEMQSLWSSILAGQANNPGAFSKRTVDIVATLDTADAHLFTKFCTFVWMIGGPTVIVLEEQHDLFNRVGINFSSLNHLDDLGLITFNNLTGFMRRGLSKNVTVFYYGQPLTIEFSQEANELQIGKVLLTRAGQELVTVCGSVASDEYYQYILNKWLEQGYILSSPVVVHRGAL
jgi:hypothetical protein